MWASNPPWNDTKYDKKGESGHVWSGLKTSDQVAPIFPKCSPRFPYVSSCFTHCFPSFFWYFPCFPWYFSLFPFLGFTPKDVSKDISKIELIIAFKDSNLLLRELMLSWSVIKFSGFFNQKFFSSVNQFVRLLERLGLRLTVLQFSRGVSIFHCLLYLVSFAFKKKMLIKF